MSVQEPAFENLTRERYQALLPHLCTLFAAAFGRGIAPDVLAWRYLDNPTNAILDLVARLPDDSLAASYSASPVTLTYGGQTVMSALSMTTMTAPSHAGRGLFTTLAAKLYEQMQAHGYELVWGFPNANSHPAFIAKLQWRDIYEIPTMSLSLGDGKKLRLPAVTPDAVRTDSRFELDYSGIAGANANLLMVQRSREYLRWRYLSHPENRYSVYCTTQGDLVNSYCITKVYQDSAIDIVDLIVSSPDEMMLLLGAVIEAARNSGITNLNCWAPRHHFCHSVYERIGFHLAAPVTYLGARVLSERRLTRSAIENYSSWYVQMGDSDVF